jgi:hypothetical protein
MEEQSVLLLESTELDKEVICDYKSQLSVTHHMTVSYCQGSS